MRLLHSFGCECLNIRLTYCNDTAQAAHVLDLAPYSRGAWVGKGAGQFGVNYSNTYPPADEGYKYTYTADLLALDCGRLPRPLKANELARIFNSLLEMSATLALMWTPSLSIPKDQGG